MLHRLSSVLLLLPLSLPVLGGCVAYTADAADLAAVAVETQVRRGGTLGVAAAIQLAMVQNAELRALEAEARAAGAATAVPVVGQGEWRSGQDTAALMFDPVALLNLGPRAAAASAAGAREAEAVVALAAARWRTTAAVVEAFLVDAALADLSVPDVQLDAGPFVAAGLASPLAAARLEAANARAIAERAELARQRDSNLAVLRRLLGLSQGAAIACGELPPDFVWQPAAGDEALLMRPDLGLAAARLRIADAEFRLAVAAQWPTVLIGPEFMLGGGALQAMAMLRLPLGMHGLAAAAREQRSAARASLEGAFLDASREAWTAEASLAAAIATAAATSASLAASARALAAARAAVAVEIEAFDRFAEAALMALRETMEHRVASVALARARLQRAVAFGWPLAPDAAATAAQGAGR